MLTLDRFPGLKQAAIPKNIPSVDRILERQRNTVSKLLATGYDRYDQIRPASKRMLQQNDVMMLAGLQELARSGARFRMEGDILVAELGTFVGRSYLNPARPDYVRRAKEITNLK